MPQTAVTVKDCVITITHTIHFNNNGLTDAQFQKAVRDIKAQLKEVWEDPEFKYKWCKVKFKFNYTDSAGEDSDTKNLHAGEGVSRQQRSQGKSTGTWFPLGKRWRNRTASHEVGHELGMKDKYKCVDANGNKVPCYITKNGKRIQNPAMKKKLPDPDDYPQDGLGFTAEDGVPKNQDIKEIVESLGADCPEECCKGKRRIRRLGYLIGGIGAVVAIIMVIIVLMYTNVPKE